MSGEKTEQPTPKKLRDARMKGQVAMSKDVVSTALLIAQMATILLFWRWYMDSLQELLVLPAHYMQSDFEVALPAITTAIVQIAIKLSAPILVVTVAVAVLANVAQVGPLMVFEPIKPDFKKLDPISKLKQIFSMKNLFEFGKSLLKVAFLSWLLYLIIHGAIGNLVHLPSGGMNSTIAALVALLWKLAFYTGMAYTIFAMADFIFQRYQHAKGLRMSKDEIKREYKESEGDPKIKGKRRQLHQELISEDIRPRVKKASVLVTNPTHLAIALYYESGQTKLPVILAKGQGDRAAAMRRIAEEEGIPIMRNIPLARALYSSADVEQFIPSQFIEPVAEVLRWVRKQRAETPTSPTAW